MFERILVPLDGSSFGEAALGPAGALARRSGGQVRLLTVHDHGWSARRRVFAPDYRRWLAAYLSALGRDVPVEHSYVVREGRTETQIVAEAGSWGADVIVMSTHGRGGVTRVWLGSVADHCVRHASVPILLVRPQPSRARNEGAFQRARRIVVPLDGGALAESALLPATALSRMLGAPLGLIRVVHPAATAGAHGLDPGGLEVFKLIESSSRAYLTSIANERLTEGIVATAEVVVDHNPARSILEYAAGDPVVIATHSRPPVERAFLGSVTDKVVRGSRGPVCVIPVGSKCGVGSDLHRASAGLTPASASPL